MSGDITQLVCCLDDSSLVVGGRVLHQDPTSDDDGSIGGRV